MAISVAAMIGRVRSYYAETSHAVPVFNAIDQREGLEFHAIPISIRDEHDSEGEAVVVRFGDRELRLRPTLEPLSAEVPGLKRHESWLAVLRFIDGAVAPPGSSAGVGSGVGRSPERLVVVVRDPHVSLDGTAHGRGRPSDSTFDLHELLPDGSIRTERYGYPLSRRAAHAAASGVTPPAGVPPLEEGTWQYYAALMTIPKGSKPTPAFTRDAVRSMGWTLPAAAVSGLVLVFSLAWVFAPRGRGDQRHAAPVG